MGAEAFPAREEGDQGENAEHDNDAIEAGTLPVTAAQVEPHAELIEGKAHGQTVEERADSFEAKVERREEENSGDGREQEDAVVKMVHVGAAGMEKHVRHAACHDEDDDDARADEGEEERDESQPGQVACRRRRDADVLVARQEVESDESIVERHEGK